MVQATVPAAHKVHFVLSFTVVLITGNYLVGWHHGGDPLYAALAILGFLGAAVWFGLAVLLARRVRISQELRRQR